MNLDRARKLVAQYTACSSTPGGEEIKEKTAQRMVETGECVWHALAQVTGKKCWCAKCAPKSGMNR